MKDTPAAPWHTLTSEQALERQTSTGIEIARQGARVSCPAMKQKTQDFLVREGRDVDLDAWATSVKPFYGSNDDYRDRLAEHVKEMRSLQDRLYADNRYALLLIFQAMDTAGKDGVIKHVMSGVNPQGCQVFSFKHPSAEELDHDFLWRTTRCLPERGRIGIFNRSYYEEVLITRVHPEIIAAQNLPDSPVDGDFWRRRYRSINHLEKHLRRNGTLILKFYLHLSKNEQRNRLLARIDDPEKNWKFSKGDLAERKLWNGYMKAYELCLSATSTKHAPWHVVPADDKQNARLIVSRLIVDALKGLKLEYPKVSEKQRKELLGLKKALAR
jgi:PPK2 family polyphosphate:nucleotide phosphotransferase